VQHILQEDFTRVGATYQDTENLINECHRIGSVIVSSLLVEFPDGRVRCSLRSRGAVDVSEIAARYGGGGHKMAAGTFLPGPIAHAKQLLLDEVTAKLF
jgi:phosphoesterase RecJ-like protein